MAAFISRNPEALKIPPLQQLARKKSNRKGITRACDSGYTSLYSSGTRASRAEASGPHPAQSARVTGLPNITCLRGVNT
eukprot:3437860-Rhodomonas_salina.1